MPQLNVRFRGVPVSVAPKASDGPSLTLRVNGTVRNIVPRPDFTSRDSSEDSESDDDSALEDGDILDDVDRLLEKEPATDAEDGPDWLFDEGETRSADPLYVFCPAPHRKQLLHLFTRHFCQHPLFPTQDGPKSSEDIRRQSVYEMYMFCHQRGLREVWGYFWTSWYAPKVWKLWARSTSPLLSRLRTTMNVENFWKQLKHSFLHNLLRPRLDQLVWILVTKVTPAYLARANILSDGHRLGRSKPLTHFQKQFKTVWQKLEKSTLSVDADKKYITRVDKWTCTCKAQPLNSCHLCKHLVDAVGPLPARFWTHVVRRRTLPLYRHPCLVPRGEANTDYIEPTDGSISDGDDHAWSADPMILEGGGGWRDLDFSTSSLLGKRARADPESDGSSAADVDEIQRVFFPSFDTHDSDDEEEVSALICLEISLIKS
ncbi:hypothetical protein DFH06DRAFT_1081519, partial [Mycena polygramma]